MSVLLSCSSWAREMVRLKVVRRCRYTHDVSAYLAAKPRDIHFPSSDDLSSDPPFVRLPDVEMSEEGAETTNSLDPTTTCPVFQRTGECRHGLKCRFLGSHVKRKDNGELELVVDEDKKARVAAAETEVNFIDADTLRKIRTKKVHFTQADPVLPLTCLVSQYPHPIADAYLKEIQNAAADEKKAESTLEAATEAVTVNVSEVEAQPSDSAAVATKTEEDHSQDDTPDVPLRFVEKKRLHWSGKTCMSNQYCCRLA